MNFRYTLINIILFTLLIGLLFLLGWLPCQNAIVYNIRGLIFGSGKTTAVITGESVYGHGAVTYDYSVNAEIYNGHSIIPYESGESFESYQLSKKKGNQVVIYYLRSKPEQSNAAKPVLPLVDFFLLGLFSILTYGGISQGTAYLRVKRK